MGWMSEPFKKDKRYLMLQLKRGKIKLHDIDTILSSLPNVSSKAQIFEGDDHDNPSGKLHKHFEDSHPLKSKQEGDQD